MATVVWWFRDGRRGHERQAEGLLEALAALTPLEIHDLRPLPRAAAVRAWLTRRLSLPLPDPDLLVGAGHATHLPLLAAQRARGGRTVVLMQPSLPNRWFDLCLIPAHDRPRPAGNVIVTRGPLNSMRCGDKDTDLGLILIGGPAGRGRWRAGAVLDQIRRIVSRREGRWLASPSPRTPPALLAGLRQVAGLEVADDGIAADPGWLAGKLERAARAWVTADSVSMIHEALTAGCAVGLLSVGRLRPRLARAAALAQAYGAATTFDEWCRGATLVPPAAPLREAERCAAEIVQRWLDAR